MADGGNSTQNKQKGKTAEQEQTLFYTNARHQLRTPLTLIEGPLKQLSKSKELSPNDRSFVDILSRNVEQLSRIVYDVLNFRNEKPPVVDDANAVTETESKNSDADAMDARVEMLVNENKKGFRQY